MTSKKWSRLLCLVLCLAVMLSCVSVAAAEEKTKITAQLLRLRATASVKGRVIDAFPKGTEGTILKKGSEWTKVRVRNKTGYMQTKFLAYSRGSSSSGSGSSGSTMYVAKGVWLYLRSAPDSSSDILGTFRGGTAVTVLSRGKYWYRVSVKGLEGYMGKEYLTSVKGQ